IIYLKNVRLVWVAINGKVDLRVLDCQRRERGAVESFKTGQIRDLPADVIQSLLAIDPFVVNGPNAPLRGPRFVPMDPPEYGFAGLASDFFFSKTVETPDVNTTEDFNIKTVDMSSGLFSFLSIGPQETRKDTVIVRQGSSQEISQGDTVSVNVHLEGLGLEHHCVEAYLDRAFGTVAVREIPCG